MDAVSQLLPGSSERSTLSLKLSSACEDKGKKYGCTAFLAVSLGAPLRYEASSASLPHTYQPLRVHFSSCHGLPHSVWAVDSALTYQIPVLDLTAAFDTAGHNVLCETLFSKHGFWNATWVLCHFSAASASSPSPHRGYFLGPPSLLYLHSSPTWFQPN